MDDHEPILAADQIAPQLSPREKLVMHCLVKGDSNKSIAKKIDIAEATVKVHIKTIRRKLRVHNRTQAALWEMKNGLNSTSSSVDTELPLSDKVHRDPSLVLFVHPRNEFGAVVERIKLLRNNGHTDERIAIVVDRYRAAELVSAVRAGASGDFVGGITRDVCIKSLEWMMIGEADLPPTFQPDVLGREEHRLDDHEPVPATDQIAPQLSPREKLILGCLVEGYSNKSIAKKIDITEATVKVHVKAILRKLRVHSRTQAAAWGMKNAAYLRTEVDTAPRLSGKVYPDVRLDDREPIPAADQIAPLLTRREKLILGCLVEGDSNKSIAKKIDIAEATVKVHVQAIHRKLRVHNRTQAAIWEMKNGLNSTSSSVDTEPSLSDKVHRDPSLVLFVHPRNEFGAVVERIKLLRNNGHTDERIAIVVDRYRAAELVSAVRAGASGDFVGGITRDVCIKSLEWMMIGEADLPPTFQPDVLGREEHRLDDHEPVPATDQIAPQLSPREKLILGCLVEGYSNKSIAKKIDIAEATVKVHVKAILRKLRVHSRTQAAIWGMKNAA